MALDSIEQKLKALEAFKDWSNYLLVTTVAALGWVSTKDAPHFSRRWIRSLCIWTFALSVFFAILTLALVPHIAELIDGSKSIYDMYWDGLGFRIELYYACLPQHLLFVIAVLFYAYGTSRARAKATAGTER